MKLHQFAATVVLLACGCSVGAESANDQPSSPDPAPEATEVAPASETASYTIVMLGDSLTAGFGLAPEDALPEKAEILLKASAPGVDVINAGVSGDTSAGGFARYDWSVASANPDLLVIELGANDYLNGIDPARTKANLASIIERAQSDGIDIVLVSLAARSSAADDPRGDAFMEIYPALARTYSVDLYEGFLKAIQDRPDLLQADGLHPTAEGVDIIVRPLVERISTFLPEKLGEPAP